MLGQFQRAIAGAVLDGTGLDAIENEIIKHAPIDDEQKAALWLYAEAVTDRPRRLKQPRADFARARRDLVDARQ